MAEYIDRNLIEWYGCNFEEDGCKNRECSDCSHAECSHSQVMQIPIADVIPIPEGATNGDMIKAMFPNCEQKEHINNGYFEMYFDGDFGNASYMRVSKDWWNALYKKGRKTREYECIKPFSVPYYDIETDSYDESQFFDIEVGSLWQREDDDFFGYYTGADIHLDGDRGWIEINEEDLERCFKLVESEGKE